MEQISNNKQQELVTSDDADKLSKLLAARGLTSQQFQVLRDVIHPNAQSPYSVLMAFDYDRARGRNPFKRHTHIVPVYNARLGRYVETVWPGVADVRTDAMRSGDYAGCDECQFGPEKIRTFSGKWTDSKGHRQEKEIALAYPEWAQFVVYKIVQGQRVAFPGPKVRWLEEYKRAHRTVEVPNDMWASRPYGQIEKCAEAAALRRAWPEQADYTAEEMQGATMEDAGMLDAPVVEEESSNREDAPSSSGERSDNAVLTREFIDQGQIRSLNQVAVKSGWRNPKQLMAQIVRLWGTPEDKPYRIKSADFAAVLDFFRTHAAREDGGLYGPEVNEAEEVDDEQP